MHGVRTVNDICEITVTEGLRLDTNACIKITDESVLELRQRLAKIEAERNEARELLANVFDRFACTMCSHGKTGPDCPCGFHAAGAFLDRTEDER